ncbi:hypothetical protein Lesp02_83130 [Lentzea sp. NBRC 105346]|nr:hypothetical protein Lesp02_83130 [Lentzea sp. NBRC 105346]
MTLSEFRNRVRNPPMVKAYLKPGFHDLDHYFDWRDRHNALVEAVNRALDTAMEAAAENPWHAQLLARATADVVALVDGPLARATGYHGVASVLIKVDDHFDAIDVLRKAIADCRRADDHELDLDAELVQMLTYALRADGDWEELRGWVPDLRQVATEAGLRGIEAFALLLEGMLAEHDGRATEAIRAMTAAVELRRSLTEEEERDRRQRLVGLENYLEAFGRIAGRLGHYADAERVQLEVVTRFLASGDARAVEALRDLAMTYHLSGDDRRAITRLREAADLAPHLGLTDEAAKSRKRAELFASFVDDAQYVPEEADSAVSNDEVLRLLAARQYEQVWALGHQVLAEARESGQVDVELSVSNSLAIAGSHTSRFDEARSIIIEAIRIANLGRRYRLTVNLCRTLAQLYIDHDRHLDAITVLDGAIALIPQIWHAAKTSHHRQEMLAGLAGLLDLHAHTMVRAEDHPSFIAVTELARSRNTTEWVLEELNYGAEKTEPLLRQLRAVDVELELRDIGGTLTSARMNELAGQRSALLRELDPSAGSLTLEGTNYELTTRRALRATARAGSAVLVLYADTDYVSWSLAHGPADDLNYTGGYAEWSAEERHQLVAGVTNSVWADEEDGAAGRDAVDRLWAGARAKLGGIVLALREVAPERLTVVPHEELVFLPWWSLADEVPSIRGVTLAPSVAMLQLCVQRDRAVHGPTVVVPDRTGDLTFAPGEVAAVRAARGGVTEPKSTSELFAEARECAVLHVSGHGFFFGANPYWSGFLATRDTSDRGLFARYLSETGRLGPEPSPGCHRVVTVAECLTRLSLPRCALAVLSACESGVPRLHAGGELTGLPNALLVAGCRSVMASMWPADDAAASLLVRFCYDVWAGGLGQETDLGVVLAMARTRLRRTTREEALAALGPHALLPPGDHPFNARLYTDVFHVFGAP